MSTSPRLTIGLPVYNGEDYLCEALDALLGQTFEDFDMIVSDNASTDTPRSSAATTPAPDRASTTYGMPGEHRLPRRTTTTWFKVARGELFKWASDDDLYGRDLLDAAFRCSTRIRTSSSVTPGPATIDADGAITTKAGTTCHGLTGSRRAVPQPAVRIGGDDDYGVIRTDVLRRTRCTTATGTRIGRSWRSSHCTGRSGTSRSAVLPPRPPGRRVDDGPSERGARTRACAGEPVRCTPSPAAGRVRARLRDRDPQGAAHCGRAQACFSASGTMDGEPGGPATARQIPGSRWRPRRGRRPRPRSGRRPPRLG